MSNDRWASHPIDNLLPIEDAEQQRILQNAKESNPWQQWGSYLSERQWGTVREDYSPDGDAWNYFPHDQARSRAYRWGEDGLGGWCNDTGEICFALAFWNGKDPILKERLFGLTNSEGNHGEDVKEYYFYLDNTPSHSYMRWQYKYPQQAYPYDRLVNVNAHRSRHDPEFELIDTGIFNDDRYFDIVAEYAKVTPDDLCIRIHITNRGAESAPIDVLPTLWFRNTWSWTGEQPPGQLKRGADGAIQLHHPSVGEYLYYCDRFQGADPPLLFTDNETNFERIFGNPNPTAYVKDGFDNYLIHGQKQAVNPQNTGTKAAPHYHLMVAAGETATLQLRFTHQQVSAPFDQTFAHTFKQRQQEADAFYDNLFPELSPDDRLIQRQALAALLWSKQFYDYDVHTWLHGDRAQPPPPSQRLAGRNARWETLYARDIISMPDKWEYPWFAAWDLAFHAVALAPVDPQFAKDQLILLTREWYAHPNGQLPAYEWAFGDVNPPVHAWAALRVYQRDAALTGTPDRDFLERIFHKLMLNFAWWVNRKDPDGRNVFQGGFLGLDNIGLFDRSKPLPAGGSLDQADGTAWMAMYALNLLRIALILARDNPVYEDIATKFFEHFLLIAEAMTKLGGPDDRPYGLWDEADGFYYDVLRQADGTRRTMRIRSMVGLIPLFAVEVLEPDLVAALPGFAGRLRWLLAHRPGLAALVSRWTEPGMGETTLLSLLRGHRIKALLSRMLDETEFLSPYGVRSLSKVHQAHPYEMDEGGQHFSIGYDPGEGRTRAFGGNSNWRGPVWMPVNYLLIDSLREFHRYYGTGFRVECPVGSGVLLDLAEVADELSERLARLFLPDAQGRRPSMPNERLPDAVLFHEYFDGDTGRGLGAAHQTGWTALVALLLAGRR